MKNFLFVFVLLLTGIVQAAELSAADKKEIAQMAREIRPDTYESDDAAIDEIQSSVAYPEDEDFSDAAMDDYYEENKDTLTDEEKAEQKKLEAEQKLMKLLTVPERTAVNLYTGEHYETINNDLRRNKGKPTKLKVVIKHLDKALSKLPKYKGDVLRNANYPADAKFTVGTEYTYHHYMSTSTTGVDFGFFWNITIKSKTGRYIDFISAVKGEDEVLMPRGSKFKVKSVDYGNLKMVWEQL